LAFIGEFLLLSVVSFWYSKQWYTLNFKEWAGHIYLSGPSKFSKYLLRLEDKVSPRKQKLLKIYFSISYKYLIPYVVTSILFSGMFKDFEGQYGNYRPSV